jgi:hypothetical protein
MSARCLWCGYPGSLTHSIWLFCCGQWQIKVIQNGKQKWYKMANKNDTERQTKVIQSGKIKVIQNGKQKWYKMAKYK